MPSKSRSSISSKKSDDAIVRAGGSGCAPAADTVDILRRWGVTVDELTRLVDENPSLRGILLGYVAEHHLTRLLAASDRYRIPSSTTTTIARGRVIVW